MSGRNGDDLEQKAMEKARVNYRCTNSFQPRLRLKNRNILPPPTSNSLVSKPGNMIGMQFMNLPNL